LIFVLDNSNFPPQEYKISENPCTKISIFLSVFDVHVNKIPISGKILDVIYKPGKFFNASFNKASEFNERNTLIIEFGRKRKMAVSQIAGLIARRICCDVKKGDEVKKGGDYGIIRFGSRVDIYFDEIVTPFVDVGHKVRVGETALLKLPEDWI